MTTQLRTFGIAAHVDAGKTTLAEQILLATGAIHTAGEIRGARPTQLDHEAVEKRRGITVNAAATTVRWRDHTLALVDTPGHVDFTVEVERALRVLDGAVLVLSAVAGVQAQTRTVEGQMARYEVPRVAFINKTDLVGADPARVVDACRTKLGMVAALVQLPIGLASDHRGVIDLVHRRWRDGPVPDELVDAMNAARAALVDTLTLHDETLLAEVLEQGEATPASLEAAIRRATRARAFVPVFVGSAARGIGVVELLDGIVATLPAPEDRVRKGTDDDGVQEVHADPDAPAVVYVFKSQETQHGGWTWVRVFRGQIRPGDRLVDPGRGDRFRLGPLGRIHAARVERVPHASAGDIVAVFGLDAPSGTTLTDPAVRLQIGGLHVPDPVVERSLTLVSGTLEQLSKGLHRLVREDPTLLVTSDAESGETRIHGMGELHLEVAATKLADRYGVEVALGDPRVAYRCALATGADLDYRLKMQGGGPGMFAHLIGRVEPADTFWFSWQVTGGSIPSAWRKAIEAGFAEAAADGAGAPYPLQGISVTITDGAIHSNDSSERAFQIAARRALRDAVERVGVVELEPMMRVVAESAESDPGTLASALAARGGELVDASVIAGLARAEATVPLARMLGFSSALRSVTAGDGTFSMELSGYAPRT